MLQFLLRPFVHRFIAGEDQASALKYAKTLRARKVIPIFDILGEHAGKKAEIVRTMGQYLQLLEGMREKNVRGDISIKLTAFGLEIEPLLCYRAVLRVVERAADQNTIVWLDMENSTHTQQTIATYRRIHAQHSNIGICVQADLKRSRRDILALLLERPRIRLVKGAYVESEEIAFESHRKIQENFKDLLKLCLEKNASVAVATHDPILLQYALHLHPTKTRIEFQLLKGVRDDEKKLLVEKGFVVKEYCAFGTQWQPYVVRRIQEFFRNMKWAMQDLFHLS